MSQTIGKHWAKYPRGDYQAQCAYCGSHFRRSQLRKDGAGRLCCDADWGPDEVTLTKENAALGAKKLRRPPAAPVPMDGVYRPVGTCTEIVSPSGGLDAFGRKVTPTS